MSKLINYIWENKMLGNKHLTTTAGEPIDIINTGKQSTRKDNIFCNARLRIADREWSGNVILHDKSSDWEREIKKTKYDNIILHVARECDVETLRKHGETIPQLQIKYPQEVECEYNNMSANNATLPCEATIASMSNIMLHSNLSRLLVERIEEKAERIARLYEACNKIWDDTLFKLLARNFGFGIQSAIFESWAAILNMQALGKHRDNPLQVEAIFFGQAGLLEESTIPTYYRQEALQSKYYNELVREFKFLKTKFNLECINGESWGGGNTAPHQRIARLAAMYSKDNVSMANIAECNTTVELRELLQIQPEGYMRNHIQFGGTETVGAPPLRDNKLDLLIINTVAPILYSYGKHRNDPSLCNKAEDYLHSLNSEDNSIVRRWAQMGVVVNCAADSQAIIQLQKAYCNKHNCRNCRFAYAYLKEKIEA